MPGLMGRPVIDAGGRSEPCEPALELRLLAGSLVFRNLQEFRQAMRHRYVLANCAGLTLPAIVLLYALDSTRMPIDLQVPSVVVGMVAAQALVITYISIAVRLARMIHKHTALIRVWVTPGLMLGAAGMIGVAQVMHRIMEVQQDWTELRSHLIPFLCILYLEVAAAVILRGPMPRALAKIRGTREPIFAALAEAPLQEGDVAPRVKSARAHAPALAVVMTERVANVNRLGFPAADVLRLEASGNYVTVITRKGRHLLPGPFAAVVAQMPADLGRQVQRSHWVSVVAVEGVKHKGREMWLQVACGALVPVSTAMRAEVQAWLEAAGKVVMSRRTIALESRAPSSTRHGSWTGSSRRGGQA
jgi:hypothetical protein